MSDDRRQRIWQVVSQIPAGMVASYGQIAALAGQPGAARFVGHVMKTLPADSRLPWHRVVNSQGCINSPNSTEQRQRLAAEGVGFRGERVAMSKHHWQNSH